MTLDMKLDTKNMSSKQKLLIPLIILAFAFVIWQLYSMFGSSSSVSSTAPAVSSVVSPTAQHTVSSRNASTATSIPAQPSGTSQEPVAASPSDLAPTEEQSQYIQLISQLQMLKMKRMLLEEEVAIAAARQKIADLNAKTGDLGGDIGSADIGVDFGNSDAMSFSGSKGDYKVVFIDRQEGEWNATLSRGGRFEEVNIGSELADGTQIISIDSKGVTVKKGLKLTRLTFSGATPIEGAGESIKPVIVEHELVKQPAQVNQSTKESQQAVPAIVNKDEQQSKDSAKKKL